MHKARFGMDRSSKLSLVIASVALSVVPGEAAATRFRNAPFTAITSAPRARRTSRPAARHPVVATKAAAEETAPTTTTTATDSANATVQPAATITILPTTKAPANVIVPATLAADIQFARDNPSLFLVLGDMSGSTARGNVAASLARSTNLIIGETIRHNTQGLELRDRVDFGLLRYGADAVTVGFSDLPAELANRETLQLTELARAAQTTSEPDPNAGTPIIRPLWVSEVDAAQRAAGDTPTIKGIGQTRRVLERWQRRPTKPHNFVLVHVLQGRHTDGSDNGVRLELAHLDRLARRLGATPFFTHIFFDDHEGASEVFPSNPDNLPPHVRPYFDASHELTPGMTRKALDLGFTLPTDGKPRLLAFGVSLRDLPALFTIGTQPVLVEN